MRIIARKSSAARHASVAIVSLCLLMGAAVLSADDHEGQATSESWLPSLMTETPQEGFALAVKLSQKGVATTQTDADVRQELRPEYAEDPNSLIAASSVIATHFQTVAAANDYWRE